jgi:hypothetical protein
MKNVNFDLMIDFSTSQKKLNFDLMKFDLLTLSQNYREIMIERKRDKEKERGWVGVGCRQINIERQETERE